MPTRLYMPSTGLSFFSNASVPTYDAGWHVTGAAAARRRLVTTKENSPLTNFTSTKTVATNPANVLLMSFITPALADQTLSNTGFLKGVLQVSCSGITLADAQMIVKVWSHGAGAVIGTPIAMQALPLSNDFGLTLQNRKFPLAWGGSGAALTQVVIGDGNWIEIEIGARFFTAATGGTVTVSLGDPIATADLAENETDTTPGVPWFEFSQTLIFNDAQSNTKASSLTPVGMRISDALDPIIDVYGLAKGNVDPNRATPLGGGEPPTYRFRGRDSGAPGVEYVTWTGNTPDVPPPPPPFGGPIVDITVRRVK